MLKRPFSRTTSTYPFAGSIAAQRDELSPALRSLYMGGVAEQALGGPTNVQEREHVNGGDGAEPVWR